MVEAVSSANGSLEDESQVKDGRVETEENGYIFIFVFFDASIPNEANAAVGRLFPTIPYCLITRKLRGHVHAH